MFPFPIAKPQKCDIQTFYGSGPVGTPTISTWNKPVGVSHIYMMCIGAGGDGDGIGVGGGSGAITIWYGAAQNTPDSLVISCGFGAASSIFFRTRSGTTLLLEANQSSGQSGGGASSPNAFAASGFFNSVNGQGGASITLGASPSTFLSGGGNLVNANYDYSTTDAGYFQMQPIIVGVGGAGNGNGGIGCGGGNSSSFPTKGGAGMVLIASW